ncbi:diguanylate cyclase domain-containing protein [Alloalcanivorax sp. C16-1]|uniref:diguanylate cyclase domain-containing protein n=1 Tax=Alloalcanivorax sp. C16-1 TaxID=3390051 RepID=UPI0039710F4D
MTSGTDTTRVQSQNQSLNPLTPLVSLCQRYQLPLSLLAIQLKDLTALGRELGGDQLRALQRQLARAMEQRVRQEDALVTWQRGYLVLCLPGTPVEGAVGLAHRLGDWFERTRFTLPDRVLQLSTAMAVHVADTDSAEPGQHEPIRELVMDTLCLLAAEEDGPGPVLSRRALRLRRRPAPQRTAVDAWPKKGDGPAPLDKQDPPGQFCQLVETLSRHGEGILVRALSPALRRLDEPTRLRLIDHLLEASLLPGAPTATADR